VRQDTVLSAQSAAHTLETNQFFVDLIAHSRTHPGTRLARWWSTTRTAAAFGGRIHPDGHGVWEAGDRSVGFYLEYDRGTMDHRRLAAKLEPYRRLRADGGPDYPILFSLPHPGTRTLLPPPPDRRRHHRPQDCQRAGQPHHRNLRPRPCQRPVRSGRTHLAPRRQRRSPSGLGPLASPSRRPQPSQPRPTRPRWDLDVLPQRLVTGHD
jgi:hypothetical protein